MSEMKNIFLIIFGDAELANDGGCCFYNSVKITPSPRSWMGKKKLHLSENEMSAQFQCLAGN
jgi:hypothetical protein